MADEGLPQDPGLLQLTSSGSSISWMRSNANVLGLADTFLAHVHDTAAHPLNGKGYPRTYADLTVQQAISRELYAAVLRQLLDITKQRFGKASRTVQPHQ